ncbi:MAG: hypothetical protein LBQ94_08440 [Treponema sp.]|jgi:mRNA-degrading endonuclease toxin of MazEF toxin-antitoxin module|nr:hypothetical protein [Treponema sp.]
MSKIRTENDKVSGVVLADQIKSLDWKTREIEFITRETPEKMNDIIDKISILLLE